MPLSRRGGIRMEMSEFVISDGACARDVGTRLEEFGFYADGSFKNLESDRKTRRVPPGSVQLFEQPRRALAGGLHTGRAAVESLCVQFPLSRK
jgi:hypothetical protein